MSNLNNTNRSTIITVLTSVTILLAAVLFVLVAFRGSIKRNLITKKSLANATEYKSTMTEYLDNRDYFGFINYVNLNNISMHYGEEYSDFMYVRNAASAYTYLCQQFMNMYLNNDFTYNEYYFAATSEYIRSVYKYAEYSNDFSHYCRDIVDETELLLKTYLKFTDDEIANIPELSDAEFTFFVEKRMEALINE